MAGALNLLVLRTDDLEKSLDFYAALGLTFEKHKHGTGPSHYACESGGAQGGVLGGLLCMGSTGLLSRAKLS